MIQSLLKGLYLYSIYLNKNIVNTQKHAKLQLSVRNMQLRQKVGVVYPATVATSDLHL